VARVDQERGQLRTGKERWESVRFPSSFQRSSLSVSWPKINESRWYHDSRRRLWNLRNRAIPTDSRFRKYCNYDNFSTFGRGENPIIRLRVTFLLSREPACRLNIIYYEGSRYYNPILNIKAAAGSRGGYCVACNVDFRNDRGHRCQKMLLRYPVLRIPRCWVD